MKDASLLQYHSRRLRIIGRVLCLCLSAMIANVAAAARSDGDGTVAPKTIVDLQPFRQTETLELEGTDPKRATLINLNPGFNAWYLLVLAGSGKAPAATYHLENAAPESQAVHLEKRFHRGLVLTKEGKPFDCALWDRDGASELNAAAKSAQAYAPLCQGRLLLRNPVKGNRTYLEAATDFLRDHVAGGEKIIALARDTVYRDRYLDRGDLNPETETGHAPESTDGAPLPAAVDPKYQGQEIVAANFGIRITGGGNDGLIPGRWYPVEGQPGIYASVIRPNLIARAVFEKHRDRVKALDSVEADAMVYLVAFDLDAFDLGFALGTQHPRIDWSERAPENLREKGTPGPDGIGTSAPLVRTGMVSPIDAPRTEATFIGGFKRSHGAFKWGELARRNRGSHYGFIENGVVFSTLQPGLATIFVLDDGTVQMKTWTEDDNAKLARIKYARQNGVPIIEYGGNDGSFPVPGSLVGQWGPGNWSGSADQKLRTVRGGACLLERERKRFLVYGYFSSATPSAMARVFQAYGCDYAMLLDMNALEHTYLAVYRRKGSALSIEHLVPGMKELDKTTTAGQEIPRFLGFPDNRDFFYLMRKAS